MLEKQTMNRIDNMARAGSDRKTVSFTVGAILLATTWMAISLFGTGLSAAQVSTSANPMSGFGK